MRIKHTVATLLSLLATILIFGCGGGSSAEDEGQVPAEIMASLPTDLPAGTRALLSDERLTFDEYESAVFANIQCLRDAGISISEGPLLEVPFQTYFYGYTDPLNRPNFIGSTARACYSQHFEWIDLTWSVVNPPDEAVLNEIWGFLVQCMTVGGLDVPTDATRDQIQAIGEASEASRAVWAPCRHDTEERFQFRLWRG